jgi:hypothetical protein
LARRHHVPEGVLTRGLAASAAALFLAAAGCDLFETRTPNDPGSSTFPCAALLAADSAFVNIRGAYGRPNGLACYTSGLADSTSPTELGFRFHPDPTDSLNSPAQFASWSRSVEVVVAQNIANSSHPDSFLLTLKTPPDIITSQPDIEVRRYAYEIKFSAPEIPDTFFQGLAEVTVRKGGGGQWLIHDWVDRRDPGGTTTRTWGYLRASYRIGI